MTTFTVSPDQEVQRRLAAYAERSVEKLKAVDTPTPQQALLVKALEMMATAIFSTMGQHNCSVRCAHAVVYLRLQTTKHTPELEARLVDIYAQGGAVNIYDWPPKDYSSASAGEG